MVNGRMFYVDFCYGVFGCVVDGIFMNLLFDEFDFSCFERSIIKGYFGLFIDWYDEFYEVVVFWFIGDNGGKFRVVVCEYCCEFCYYIFVFDFGGLMVVVVICL